MMIYVCIHGGSYENRDFDERELLREQLRQRLLDHHIRFLEYCWVWDEKDRCLLLTGKYEQKADAEQWIKTLKRIGFHIIIRQNLPGEPPEA